MGTIFPAPLREIISRGDIVTKSWSLFFQGLFDNAVNTSGLTSGSAIVTGSAKELTALTPAAKITDASTSHAITDPADTPADVDTLRDDLVANTIPDINSALDALGTKMNLIIDAIEAGKISSDT